MDQWCEIIEIIDSKYEGDEMKFHVSMRCDGHILGAWLPFSSIPSQKLFQNYYKQVINRLSKHIDLFDQSSRQIYDLLGQYQNFELDSLRKEYLTIRGLVLPHSNKIGVFKKIKSVLKNPLSYDSAMLDNLRRDILLEKLIERRKTQLANLKACEWRINTISDNRKDIIITNDVDLEEFPSHLVYINRYVINSDSIPDGVAIECDCKSKTSCTGNSCTHYFRDEPKVNPLKGKSKEDDSNRYDQNGEILPDVPRINTFEEVNADDLVVCNDPYDENGRVLCDPTKAVYECNKFCKCDETCPKRVVQNGANLRLEIFKTWNNCGWGVRTLEDIPARTFVSRYAGEVIPWEEGNRRARVNGEYLFDIDFSFNPEENHCPYTVDAYKYGNISRFINHSCKPNLLIYSVYINNIFHEMPEIAFFARRDILAGEELTLKYDKLVKKSQCMCADCR